MTEIDYGVPAVQMQGVHKWFGAFHALNGINLTVQPGARIVGCGPSGCTVRLMPFRA